MQILFIGNSHTHVNDVPGMVGSLLRWGPAPLAATFACTTDSVGLAWHWKRKQTHESLRERRFDFVVLQERSGGPLEDPASTSAHAACWAKAVFEQGAVPVIYETWALASNLEAQPGISALYDEIVATTGARLAPVGRAWALARRERPNTRLHDTDGRHAAWAGSYLAAAVIARTLASERWPHTEVPGPSSLAPEARAWLWSVAARASQPG